MTAIAVLAAASLAVAGCGSDSSTPAAETTAPAATTAPEATTTAPATTAPAAATAVAVTLGSPKEFSVTVDPAEVPAGETTFTVDNKGALLHEMVVVPAPDGAAALKEANGEASEEGAAGEVADLAAGKTDSVTITLPAGKYALLCNLPGHFAGGMYADFTVK